MSDQNKPIFQHSGIPSEDQFGSRSAFKNHQKASKAFNKSSTFAAMKIIYILSLFLLTLISAQAQVVKDTGKTEVKQDPRVGEMLQKYRDSRTGKIKGYRVQIHFGAEQKKSKDIKSKFLTRFPDMRAYDTFETPYFKIRVGDFRTKLEAYKFMKQIQDDFPGAFIVQDEIELPPL